MLDIKLETLLMVYEEMSFTKAATKLALTQPAVSNHIVMLEKQIGCTLCRREKGKVCFTSEGEIVVNYAKRFKAMYEKMCEEVKEKQRIPKHIKIGVTRATESDPVVVYAIGQYIRCNTGLSITVVAADINKLYEMLENYEVDIVIADAKPSVSRFLYRLLDRDNLVCIVANTNSLSQKKSVSLQDLKKERLIMRRSTSVVRALFETTLESINETLDDFNIILEVDSVNTIKLLVRKDVGVSIMPEKSCRHDLNCKKYKTVQIENVNITREVNLIYRKDFSYMDILDDLCSIYSEIVYD